MKKRLPSTRKQKTPNKKSRSALRRSSPKGSAGPSQSAERPHTPAGRELTAPVTPAATLFRLDSRPKRYISIAALVVVLGAASLYFYIDILLKLHNYYTLILVVPMYGYIFGDLFMWLRAGVRSLEIDGDEIRVTIPNQPSVRCIGKSEIGSVRVSSTIDGKTVHILLHGAKSSKFLWMNFYSGPRIRIPEAPFSKGDFLEFIERLGTLATVTR